MEKMRMSLLLSGMCKVPPCEVCVKPVIWTWDGQNCNRKGKDSKEYWTGSLVIVIPSRKGTSAEQGRIIFVPKLVQLNVSLLGNTP